MELMRKKPSNPTTYIFYDGVGLRDQFYVTCKGSFLQAPTFEYPDCESYDASEGLVKHSTARNGSARFISFT